MKTTILFFLTILSLVGCSKDSAGSKTNQIFQLPPETQTGANTFGVTINGKVYVPRDPTGFNLGPSGHGIYYAGSTTDDWSEIRIIDGASATGFKMTIHFKNIILNALVDYPLKNSNFQDGLDSSSVDHIYFKIWDQKIGNYEIGRAHV